MNRGVFPTPYAAHRARFGSILDVFDPFTDVFTSIVDRVPGSGWVKDVAAQGGTWIKDFANLSVGDSGSSVPVGYLVITLVSGGAYQGLEPIVGPAVASVVWTVPDLAQGNTSFTQAYAKEFLDRLKRLITFLVGQNGGNAAAAGVAANAEFTQALTTLANDPNFRSIYDGALAQIKALRDAGASAQDALKKLGLTPQDIAAKFGVREDVATAAIDAALHEFVYDFSSDANDAATGKLPPKPLVLSDFASSANAKARPPTAPETGTADQLLTELLDAQKNSPGDFVRIAHLQQAFAAQKASEDAIRAQAAADAAPLPPGAVRVAPWVPLSVTLGPSLPAAGTTIGATDSAETPSLGAQVVELALVTSPAWLALFYVLLRRPRHR